MTTVKTAHYAIKSNPSLIKSIKDVDMTGRLVECVYNTFNFIDSYGDVLLPGCSSKSIRENGPKSNAPAKIKHLLFHDLNKPTGNIKELEETNIDGMTAIRSLVYFPDTTDGNNTLKNYEAEVYDNHSIGFNYLRTEFLDKDSKGWGKAVQNLLNPEDAESRGYMFLIKEIQLWEGSTVAFGANALTPCLGIKDATPKDQLAEILGRMDMVSKAMQGKPNDEARHGLFLQMQQLKQMIEDLVTGTGVDPREAALEKEIPVVKSGILSLEMATKFSLK